jgi:beta-phosphoglucomutase
MKNNKFKAILFDLDGVLVNMPDGHYQALNSALSLFGAKIKKEEHASFFNGLPTRKKVEMLESQGRIPVGLVEVINAIKQDYTKDAMKNYCSPDYAKMTMLKYLKDRGFKLACCSNSIKETLHMMLKSACLYDFFDLIIGNDEVTQPKPDPEIYLRAFKKFNVAPKECVIVEDAPHGLEAARLSGAVVFHVRGCEDVDLSLFKGF